jgi:hypothetical protein
VNGFSGSRCASPLLVYAVLGPKALPTHSRPFVGYSLIWQQHQDDFYNIEYNEIIRLRVIYDGATLRILAWKTKVATITHARSTSVRGMSPSSSGSIIRNFANVSIFSFAPATGSLWQRRRRLPQPPPYPRGDPCRLRNMPRQNLITREARQPCFPLDFFNHVQRAQVGAA